MVKRKSSVSKKKTQRFNTVHIINKSLRHHVIEWVATFLSAMGAILNSNLFGIDFINTYFFSFYFWFVADLLWISFAHKHKHWGVFTTFTIFGIINFLAILKNAGLILPSP